MAGDELPVVAEWAAEIAALSEHDARDATRVVAKAEPLEAADSQFVGNMRGRSNALVVQSALIVRPGVRSSRYTAIVFHGQTQSHPESW
jgi:hypothetical protein